MHMHFSTLVYSCWSRRARKSDDLVGKVVVCAGDYPSLVQLLGLKVRVETVG